MPNFAYNLRTATGRTENGIITAPDARSAASSLREDGNLVLALEPTTRSPEKAASRTILMGLPFVRPRVATLEVALQQISIMLDSGLTLLEALRATAAQTTTLMRVTLMDVAESVQAGRSLSQALGDHSWMGRMVRQLVEVGEATGTLDIVLNRAAKTLEKRRLLIGQAISALMYPLVVFLAAIGVTAFMLIYAVPRLTTYLTALGRPLPAMTQILVDASNFLLTWWPTLAGVSALLLVCGGVAYSVPTGRLLIDSVILRIPVIGFIWRTSATALFSRSFALLLSSGVTIIEALRTCQDLHKNRRLAVLIASARESVIAGAPLAPAMTARKTFTPMLASMIAIGERSGNIDETLMSCAIFHEQRLEALIRTLSSLVEIAVIVIVGGIVGYVYIAFMLAMYGAAL
jgi:type IV pilus assembly protein PilC